MITLTFDNGRAHIERDGKILMADITLELNCFDGKSEVLYAREWVEDRLCFYAEEGSDRLYLSCASTENEAALRISGQLKHAWAGAPSAFALNNSVVVRFRSLTADGIMANYQCSEWWTRPAFADSTGNLPDRSLSVLCDMGGSYVHFYPMCDDIYRTCIRGEGDTTVLAASVRCSGHDKIDGTLMAIGVGVDPYKTVHNTMRCGLNSVKEPVPMVDGRKDMEALDLLGWCTYDAFYNDVTHDKIIQKLKEFKSKNIPLRMMIIDAGWFCINIDESGNRMLTDLCADSKKFPHGLKALIEEAKRDYGIEKVGLWHALPSTACSGVMKDSPAWHKTHEFLIELNNGLCYPSFERDKAFGFFDRWHSHLKNEGVDFLKVDFQGYMPLVANGIKNVNRAMKDIHAGLEASAALHFDGNIINCMGMSQENVQSRPITGVSRNSDDFFPKKELGFSEHFLQNAYNSVYHGLMYHCDFDMWWTEHWSSHQNALLRAVSGGPVYVSDPIDKTDPTELMRLCDANGVVYRCDRNGTVCRDNLFSDPTRDGTLSKMFNLSGDAAAVAAFNTDLEGKTVSGKVKPTDVEQLEGDRFICYVWDADRLSVVGRDEGVEITLERDGGELVLFAPIKDGFGVLGILDKYISPATVIYSEPRFALLSEGGRLAFYSEQSVNSVTVDGTPTEFKSMGDGIYTADIPCSDGDISVVIE